MLKNDKIYRIVSIINFILHICVFMFVVVVGFLPFLENYNFYECFVGFFGKALSTLQPYFLMTVLLLTCIFAFLAIKKPSFSILMLASTLSFFVTAIMPYAIEAMVVGFASPWVSASMSTYNIRFKLIGVASYIVYFDMAFLVYSIITLIIRGIRNS